MAAEIGARGRAEPPGPLRLTAVALLFAGVGAVSGLHVLGLLVGRAQFLTTRGIEQLVAGLDLRRCLLPAAAVPRADWLQGIGLIGRQPWLLALSALALFAAMGGLLAVVNPQLLSRLRQGEVSGRRVVGAALATGCVLALAVAPLPSLGATAGWLRAALAGGLVWLLWHQRGWLHPTDNAPPRLELLGHLVSGAIAGLLAHLTLRHTLTLTDQRVLSIWLGGGFWSDGIWRELTLYAIGGRAIGGLAVGTLLGFLGQSRTSLSARRWRVAPALLLLTIALLVATGQRRRWIAEADWGGSLADRLVLPAGPPAPRPARVLVVLTDGPLAGRPLSDETLLQLPADPDLAASCRRYLAAQGEQGCLVRDAFVLRHDAAAVAWDTAGMLAVQEAQLATPSPSPVFMAVLLETLGRCQALPEAEAAVGRLTDHAWYRPTDPLAAETLVGLAWRWGQMSRVTRLRERLPALWQRLAGRPAPGRAGRVTGRLLLNGQPMANVRVGVIHAADTSALSVPPPTPLGPWAQRWLLGGTQTAADGSFAIDRLFDGEYRVVVALPEADWPTPGPLAVSGFAAIRLTQEAPTADLGMLALQAWQPPPPTVEARWDGNPDGRAGI